MGKVWGGHGEGMGRVWGGHREGAGRVWGGCGEYPTLDSDTGKRARFRRKC